MQSIYRPWYQSRRFWHRFAFRFVPATLVSNLAWEIAQLPLYTIWTQATPGGLAYAVLHCLAGDVLIACAALLLVLCVVPSRDFPKLGLARVAVATTILASSYSVLSEWLNTGVREAWTYTAAMPRVPLLGTGLSPFLQWIVLPPVIIWLAFAWRRS
jgi:hypothetical protein